MYLGIRIYSRTVRTAHGVFAPLCGLLRFAFLFSQSNHISLHMDVKERTRGLCFRAEPTVDQGENGGPDRTRTYDPRLIKAVL
jgi:hypothetical protein